MLTNKNWGPQAFSTIRWVFAVCIAVVLAGCQPPGPKSLLLGEKYIEQGDYEKALRYLTRASELIPEHPQVWNHLGLAYHGVNQPTKAVEAYHNAIKIDRNLPAPHYNLGVLLLEQQHLPQAVAELNAFVKLEPESSAGWTKLGTALVRMNRPDDAERMLLQALRLDPKNPEAHNSLGLAHMQRKRPREAMLSFNKALEDQIGYSPALLNQAVVAHQHFGNKELALERYRAYLSTKPDQKTAAQVEQAIRLLEKEIAGTELAAAESSAAAPAAGETNSFSSFLRTNAATRIADVSSNEVPAAPTTPATNLATRTLPAKTNAPVAANMVAATQPTNAAPVRRATNLVAAPVTNTAVRTNVTVASASQETNSEATAERETEPELVPLEVEIVSAGNVPEFEPVADVADEKTGLVTAANPAVEEPRPLIIPRRERKEEEKPGLLSRVNPMRWFKDEDKEEPAAEVTIARQETAPPARPSYPPVVKPTNPKPEPPRVIARYQYRRNVPLKVGNRSVAQKVFQQGVTAHQKRMLPAAMEAYQNATTIDPSFYDAHYNLGLAAYQSKNLPLALAANELAVAAQPNSKEARYNFALTLREANYPMDAANELRTLVEAHPEEIRGHFALANLYAQQLDQPALARKHYQAVLELNPSHSEAPSIRQWLASN